MDEILEELSVFWANTEVVLDLLTKKGQHVEQFIGFASKPRLMARFRERMERCESEMAHPEDTNSKPNRINLRMRGRVCYQEAVD